MLASVTVEGSALHVIGSLHSSPASDLTIEFFASPACDAAGHGPGEVFLGSAAVFTDGAGDAEFDVLLPDTVAHGWVVTSTATLEPSGATSEFSECVPATGGVIPGDVDGDGVCNINDLLLVLGAWGPCAGCPEDLDGSGTVNVVDLLLVLANWSEV